MYIDQHNIYTFKQEEQMLSKLTFDSRKMKLMGSWEAQQIFHYAEFQRS